jgi:hypothetical protein
MMTIPTSKQTHHHCRDCEITRRMRHQPLDRFYFSIYIPSSTTNPTQDHQEEDAALGTQQQNNICSMQLGVELVRFVKIQ